MRLWVAALMLAGCGGARSGAPVVRQLESEILAARQRLVVCTAQAETCAETAAPAVVYRELREAFTGTEIAVWRDGARTAVVLPLDLVFSSDAVRIKAEAGMALDLLATAIKLHPELRARVTVHSDERPMLRSLKRAAPDKLALTTAQARVLVAFLSSTHGVAPTQLVAAGHGAAGPIAPGDTPFEQARNRRVVVELTMLAPWDRPGAGDP